MPPSGILLDAFKMKPADAIKYLQAKGHRFSWHWYDTWQEAHAKAFTVAKAMRMDVLQSIRDEVTRSLTDGRTFAQFKKELTPRLKALGWWGKVETEDGKQVQLGSPYRLRTIYQTNIQSAYQAGHYKRMKEVAAEVPWWKYVAVMDSKTRPAHKALNGKVFRSDDPVWDRIMPPNGFNCRCTVVALTDNALKRLGITPEDSTGKVVSREVVLKDSNGDPRPVTVHGYKTTNATGQPVTMWTDPGWDYNPGKAAWQPDLDKYSPEVARQYVEGVVTGPDYKRFFEAKGALQGEFPVAVLDKAYQKLIGAVSQTVRLSSESLRKNATNHPELILAEYQIVPDIIQNAQLIVKVGDVREVFVKRGERIYRATVKATKTGDKLYLVSLHRADAKIIAQMRIRGEVLRDEM
jgi:SPP1 gp7 family putative phage head morphogenesis protein